MAMEMEMSKTYQYRKVMKPMLERKRRARINKCLDDLKDLMVECLTQEGEHVTRLEKADILELTVEHMKKLKKRGSLSLNGKQLPSAPECFRSGYVHAADQISKILATMPGVDIQLGSKVMTFLAQKLMELQTVQLANNSSQPYASLPTAYSSATYGWHSQPFGTKCYSSESDRSSVSPISTECRSKESSLMWRPW